MATSITPPVEPATGPLRPVRQQRRPSQMLTLPLRGDAYARRWWWAGVIAYVLLAGVFGFSLLAAAGGHAASELASLVGFGERPNYAITGLVLGGLVIAIAAAGHVWNDIREMRLEEDDIQWVKDKGREGLMLVLAPNGVREKLWAQGVRTIREEDSASVESIVDDRVRKTSAVLAGGDSLHISPEEFRLVAEKRTSAYGSSARYASSLLLLFAVLGTFAGVKTALPGLIAAVSDGATGPAGAAVGNIKEPLQAVADAFGGNALALIGAIALGLMAQGILLGRRNLLERLELISSEYIYRDVGVSATNPLTSAVEALNRTARDIRASNGALLGIEGGLETLGADFQRSFQALENRLADLAGNHETELYGKTERALAALHAKVGDLADTVATNASVYGGLVDRIGERAAESRDAITQLRDSNVTLRDAMSSITTVGHQSRAAFEDMERASQQLASGGDAMREQLGSLTHAITESQPTLRHVDTMMQTALQRMEELDRKAAESWKDAGEQLARTFADRKESERSPVVASAPMSPEAVALLRRIADGVQAPRSGPSAILSAIVSLGGVLVGAGLVYAMLRLL
jgi:phage shock protein A